jgi:uncharacterized membrane protein YcaP (DUF421 family)
MEILPHSWAGMFVPQIPMFETVARGSLLYFGILILMRIMPRRTGGELATMDLIFVVLIAQSATHALGDSASITDAMTLILVFTAWNYLINALSYRIPLIEKLVSSPPLRIVRDGRILRRNMRREFVTEEELMASLRQQGIDDIGDVKAAFVEGEGQITVVRRESAER